MGGGNGSVNMRGMNMGSMSNMGAASEGQMPGMNMDSGQH